MYQQIYGQSQGRYQPSQAPYDTYGGGQHASAQQHGGMGHYGPNAPGATGHDGRMGGYGGRWDGDRGDAYNSTQGRRQFTEAPRQPRAPYGPAGGQQQGYVTRNYDHQQQQAGGGDGGGGRSAYGYGKRYGDERGTDPHGDAQRYAPVARTDYANGGTAVPHQQQYRGGYGRQDERWDKGRQEREYDRDHKEDMDQQRDRYRSHDRDGDRDYNRGQGDGRGGGWDKGRDGSGGQVHGRGPGGPGAAGSAAGRVGPGPVAAPAAVQAAAAQADPNWASREGQVYTVLTRNIQQLVASLTPSDEEVQEKAQVLQEVRNAALSAFPEYRTRLQVEPFGSYVCGLGTRTSDIDVVLVGIMEPPKDVGFYSKQERPRVARLLDRLVPELRRRLRLQKCITIRHSRVPIIKTTVAAPSGSGSSINVDISIACMSGPAAAEFIRQQVASYPPLRPLVLVLKTFMKSQGLAEVATGGLSSYGLTYMVLAHLMEEARRGTPPAELGWLLHTAVRRYGRNFDCGSMAVSVAHGGLVNKGMLGFRHTDHGDRIVTIDPLTSRNCTEGTFRSQEVLQALARADAFLSTWSAMPPEHVPDSTDILAPLLGGQVGPGGVVRAAGGAGPAGQGGAGRAMGGSKGNTPASLGKRGREEVDDGDNWDG